MEHSEVAGRDQHNPLSHQSRYWSLNSLQQPIMWPSRDLSPRCNRDALRSQLAQCSRALLAHCIGQYLRVLPSQTFQIYTLAGCERVLVGDLGFNLLHRQGCQSPLTPLFQF